MLLAVDIGNSNIVYGIYHEDRWQYQWREETAHEQTPDEKAAALQLALTERGISSRGIKNIVLSSVVPERTPALLSALHNLFGDNVLLVNETIYHHLPLNIINTKEIGSDLVANAMAGFTRFTGAAFTVVDFGTALTLTTVSATGDILGVSIAPGLKTSIRSLATDTAKLPEVPLAYPDSALGMDTIHAIQSGVLIGYTGMVKYMIEQIKSELNDRIDTPHYVVATGGLSRILVPLSDVFDEIDTMLTLDGLRLIADTCNGKNKR